MGKGGAADRARGGKPLYGTIRGRLLERIGRREWSPGEALPNEVALAQHFDVSVGTVRKAIEGLEASGVIVRRQGLGTFVSEHGAEALERRFMPLLDADGRRPVLDYTVLRLEERSATADEVARLRCAPDGTVISVVQRVSANGARVGVEASVVPAAALAELRPALESGCNIYVVLATAGLLAHGADDRLHIRGADDETAAILQVAAGAALLCLERTTFGVRHEVIELRSACYLPDGICYGAVI